MAYPLVPVPGTGDNGYRPNFTIPSPDEARQARLRGAPLGPEQARAYESSPEGRSTARQYNQARFDRAGGGARVPPAATPTVPTATPTATPAAPAAQPARGALRGAVDAATKFGGRAAATAGAVGGALRVVSSPAMLSLSSRPLANGELPPEIGQMYEDGAPYNGTKSLPHAAMMPNGSAAREAVYGKAPAARLPNANAPNTVAQNPANTGAPGQQGAAATPGMTGWVTKNGNEYSGMNVGGDITINGFAPGAGLSRGSIVSPQNMAAADGLAAQQERASLGRVMGAQQPQQPLRQFSAPTVNHSGNDWTSREMLRRAKMDASSLIHQSSWAPKGSAQAAQEVYKGAMEEDLKARNMAPELQAETDRTNASIINTQTSADASRYNSDNSLRGTMYGSDNTLRGNIYDADSRSVSAREKLASDQKKALVDRRDKATERLDKVFSSYAPGRDGKVDEGRLASLRNNAQAFIGSAAEAARKRGDTATATALEEQGLAALADDPALMQRYAASMKADDLARNSWFNKYVGTDNPGGREITGVEGGKVTLSDGTTIPRAKIEYMNNGILPHRLADWDPTADPTNEFLSLFPGRDLRKVQP